MDEQLDDLARTLFVEARQVLVVGTPGFAHGGITSVADLDALTELQPGFDGALWSVEGESGSGFDGLRRVLLPGSRILVVSRPRRGPLAFLKSRSGATSYRERADALCEAVLMAGLCEPTIHLATSRAYAVSGAIPTCETPLDALFTQPPS